MSDFEALHFLRPLWLAGVPLAILLAVLLGWRQRVERQWRGRIAPHLLAHLVVRPRRRIWPGPRAWLVTLLAVGCIALAGPSWQREAPAFVDDRGALVIVLDLAPGMNASDVAPTRLLRAKQKIGELLALRKNARTGLVVFANTAHRVMPLTDDPVVLKTYLDALETSLLPSAPMGSATSRRLGNALDLAHSLLEKEAGLGSVLVVSDGNSLGPIDAAAPSTMLWLFGTPARDAPVLNSLSRVDATLDAADVVDVHQRIEQELSNAAEDDPSRRWEDGGTCLLWPLLLLAALGFRRGWSVSW